VVARFLRRKEHLITIIDYGLGNLRSVQKAFEHLGVPAEITSDAGQIARADKLVLPGVGAFAAGICGLRARGLIEPIQRAAAQGVPLFGICLGMQLLFESSEEVGDGFEQETGLGLLQGCVTRLPSDDLVVPHVGWNQIRVMRDAALLHEVPNGAYAYFVHSYICQPRDANVVLATTDYGIAFASVVARENVWGIQFHPEKSQQVGLRILRNFLEMV